jgi:hypothetical protein
MGCRVIILSTHKGCSTFEIYNLARVISIFGGLFPCQLSTCLRRSSSPRDFFLSAALACFIQFYSSAASCTISMQALLRHVHSERFHFTLYFSSLIQGSMFVSYKIPLRCYAAYDLHCTTNQKAQLSSNEESNEGGMMDRDPLGSWDDFMRWMKEERCQETGCINGA